MLSQRALAAFRSALGPDRVFDDTPTLALYAHDETPHHVEPDAVLFPASHDMCLPWCALRLNIVLP